MRTLVVAAAFAAAGAAVASPQGVAADAALPSGALAARLGPPVAASALAGLRGGFLSIDGRVSIAFGLRQTVSVNGVPVAHTSVDARAPLPLLVFQNGAGNAAGLAATATTAGAVLQNTLSGQQLQVQRVIDVSVDSLQRLQGIALQRDVVSGLVGSLQR